ncbi:MAG: glycosyltransferase family 4 protein [Candidatus Bathyarchaeota archaeon]|nr:glycosyltransferase family 4 protein [Candidatus Bathyarchaeota archaeon]
MRIAVFVEFFPPKLGSDRRIYELMKRLSKNHEIHFVVLPPFRMLSGKLSLPQSRFHFQREEVVVVHQDIIAHYIQTSRLMLKLWKKSYILAYFLTLVSLFFKAFKSIKKIDPQVIVLNYPSVYTGVLGFIIGEKLLRKFVLLDFNDLIAQYTIHLLNLKPRSIAAKICVSIQDFIVKNSDKVIATTNYIKKYALDLAVSDEKIIVIPNGVDAKYFDPQKYAVEHLKSRLNLSDKKICLYCGRLDGWAGMNVVSQLCEVFNARKLDACFVIVGDGKKEKDRFAEDAVVLGEVSYEKVPEILVIADVVLVPFPDTEVSRAASPLKLFEGMAMGKAIVASEVDGIKEVISNQENGVLVNPNNIAEWIKAVTSLLSDSSMAKRIGENARQTVKEKYDWELLAKKYEKSFTEKHYLKGVPSQP